MAAFPCLPLHVQPFFSTLSRSVSPSLCMYYIQYALRVFLPSANWLLQKYKRIAPSASAHTALTLLTLFLRLSILLPPHPTRLVLPFLLDNLLPFLLKTPSSTSLDKPPRSPQPPIDWVVLSHSSSTFIRTSSCLSYYLGRHCPTAVQPTVNNNHPLPTGS
ncbi:hypothetical protein LZ31DRAFT_20999 [Colletotrichum somersetense]|nr:hypothetical protein LZ31DRAFT_20999 [Colletotrichum somersetense]